MIGAAPLPSTGGRDRLAGVDHGSETAARRTLFVAWPWILAAHLPLGWLFMSVAGAATVHALLTLSLGVWWAGSGRHERLAYCLAYLAGCEVLWRMADARLPWEFGKYATILLCVSALMSARRVRVPAAPLLYFLLLVPSVFLTIYAVGADQARDWLSFYLSGPLALTACAVFFANARMTWAAFYRILLCLGAAGLAVAGAIHQNLVAASSIQFSASSSFLMSGGFGPNQVSGTLGLTAMACALAGLAVPGLRFRVRVALVALGAALTIQAALTFSRGGVAMALLGMLAASLFLVRGRSARWVLPTLTVATFFAVDGWIAPKLDEFTDGFFSQRFSDTDFSERDRLARIDLEVWQAHPFVGVGPGLTTLERERVYGSRIASHTEVTRVLAEHGLLGLAALLVILAAGAGEFYRAPSALHRAVIAASWTWGLAFMMVYAFRTVLPALVLGVTFAEISSHLGKRRHDPTGGGDPPEDPR